jgi:hypothetical protein
MAFSNIKWDIPFRPWAYFWVFLVFNTLLAFPMPFWLKLEIGLIGIALPMILALGSIKPEFSTESSGWDFKPGIALNKTAWALVFTAVFAVLFFATFRKRWPALDDAIFAHYSVQLAQNWEWKFFFSPAESPPFFNWILALFFRFFEPSLFSINCILLLFSLLTVAAVYISARTYFPAFFSTLCFLLFAFGFWPLYAGQFCMSLIALLFFEILALGSLGRITRTRSDSKSYGIAIAAGVLTGFGFFVSGPWILIAVMIMVPAFVLLKSSMKLLTVFLAPFLFLFGVFVGVSIWQGNGNHVQDLWAFRPGMNWTEQLTDSLSNITALFWNTHLKSYGPAWGGMLNPLWSSVFFIGMLECWRMRNRAFVRWLWIGMALFLVPGLVSRNSNIFRLLQIFPLLVLVVCVGFQALLSRAEPKKIILLLSLFLFFSTVLDLRHLTVAYRNNSPEEIPFSKAYQFVREKALEAGPGLLLFDLRANTWDKTLIMATYPFDATRKRHFSFEKTKWAAVLLNIHYKPFLDDLYGGIQWRDLGNDILWNEGGLVLGIIPVDSRSKSFLDSWNRMNLFFRSLTNETMDYYSEENLKTIVKKLDSAGGLTGGDRFLESCLSEKKLFSKLVCKSPEDALKITQQALERGYALPTFQTAEGLLLCRFGRREEARQVFRKALQARLNLTPAREYLAAMDGAGEKK